MGKSLWGNLEDITSEVKFPKEILDEQAEYLRNSFGNLVKGKVLPIKLPEMWEEFYKGYDIATDFSYTFTICSDYVKRFQYEICKVTYGIKMYPVAISFESGIAEEVSEVFDLEDEDTIIAYDEEFMISVLEKILSSREVHQVLAGLVSLAQKEKEAQNTPF